MKIYKIEITETALEQIIKMSKQYIKSAEYIMENRASQYTDEELNEIWIKSDELKLFLDKVEDMPF